ncbi:Putative transcriptional regulator, TetR family [Mycobacteroides abscessus subsp. massiliense]|nr:Putative transcriptional regulator, TetR family [Mycobacteroides abscessus subsp. massiliense]
MTSYVPISQNGRRVSGSASASGLVEMNDRENCRRPLRKDAERNRQRVIEAARHLCATKGLDATLNDVAHHAGVGVGTVYRRFATKEDLFKAIFEDRLNQVADLAETALREQDSWQGFASFVQQVWEITVTDRGMGEIAFSKIQVGERLEAARHRLLSHLSKLVERAQNDGHLRPEVSPTDIPMMGLMLVAVSQFAGAVEPHLWRRYVEFFLEGLRNRNPAMRLELNALSDDQLDTAIQTWRPDGLV